MKKKMILTTILLLIGFAISLPIFILTNNAVIEIVTITIGVTLYHFAMRLAVGTVVNLIMKNEANHESVWFREKRFEKKLYNLLRVRKWRKYIPTYKAVSNPRRITSHGNAERRAKSEVFQGLFENIA